MGNTACADASRKPACLHSSCIRAAMMTSIVCSVTGGVVLGQSLSQAPTAQIKSTPSIVVGLGTSFELTLRDAIDRCARGESRFTRGAVQRRHWRSSGRRGARRVRSAGGLQHRPVII